MSQDGNTGAEFINNIIGNVALTGHHIGWGSSSTSGAASTVRNNLFGGGVRIAWGGTNIYTSLSSFLSATGKGEGSLSADPRFADANLMIRSDSPAINAGYATSGGGPHPVFALFDNTYPGAGGILRDADGRARPTSGALWDLGAYELGGSTTTPTPPAAPSGLRIIR
jgi:hypothetical protein